MSSETFDLKLLIDNTRGIVFVAEADDKFIDALTDEVHDTSFLFGVVRQTAPAGSSVVNLCNSYDDLYETSSDSDSETTPNSDEVYCCRSCFRFHAPEKLPCPECRKDMSLVPNSVQPPSPSTPAGIYMITDDLKFKLMSALSMTNHMLTSVDSVDVVNALEERVVKLSHNEVAKLVRTASHSNKVLTDFLLNKVEDEAETEAADAKAKDEGEAKADSVKREEFVVNQDEAEWPALDKIKLST